MLRWRNRYGRRSFAGLRGGLIHTTSLDADDDDPLGRLTGLDYLHRLTTDDQ
jgi:hypothetical protein